MKYIFSSFSFHTVFWVLLPAALLLGCARKNYGLADARLPTEATQAIAPSADTLHNLAAGRHYNQHGAVFAAFLGRHYRGVWAVPVSAPVLDLAHAAPGAGPLRPGKAGGGYQSISLTLKAANGRNFALRVLDKDPRKTLPMALRHTFALNAVRDATSAANPYAALVVPPLAEAVGLVVAHPRIVYVRPDETGLGPTTEQFQGKLALLEEKYDNKASLSPALAGATALLDGESMLKTVYADSRCQIRQAEFLKARLLDVWLGDWDRHEGQWQWAAYPGKTAGQISYRPIAKDRDQVFYRFDDGLLPWLASRPFIAPQFQTFKPRYGNVRGLVKQAIFIDQRGLSMQTRADFARAAHALQARWADTLIERAVRRFPPAVYALEGTRTAATLRQRRDALPTAADAFYRTLARRPVMGGTSQAEQFIVQRWADSVTVRMYDGSALRYARTFYPTETQQITLDGLAGDDSFRIVTDSASRRAGHIRLVVLGGPGTDQLQRKGSKRGIVFYDDATGASTGNAARPRKLNRRYRRPYNRLNDD